MLQRTMWLTLGVCVLLAAGPARAEGRKCSPTNINYCKKEKSLFGGKEYVKYAVKCSDGRVQTITAWDNRKKWCVGKAGKCTTSQIKTAKYACQH